MKKTETLFIGGALIAIIAVAGGAIWYHTQKPADTDVHEVPTTKFGDFLATQHAIHINDFDTASKLSAQLDEVNHAIVKNSRYISEYLSGKMPNDVLILESEKTMPALLIFDTQLALDDKWDVLYKRHKNDKSALSAAFRIWSSVATGHTSDAIKFIADLPTNASWKSFVRGQIYAETGDIEKAKQEFETVSSDFININDYLYLMSFYTHHDMKDAAEKLKISFTQRPGGMFMLNHDTIPDWSIYKGYKNALAFSLVQNVSHTSIMMYSDLSILLLRFAQITSPGFGKQEDTMNYYIGQYFYNTRGDWKKHFDSIDKNSPYYMFAVLRTAEKTNNFNALEKALKKNPLFVPAMNKLIAHNISQGNKRAALRIANRAIENENINETARAFFKKSRAQIYFVFGDFDKAQKDIRAASDVLTIDPDILSLQAQIWAAQNREIENAYDYAMTLVKKDPTDIAAWDTLGFVVAAREGDIAALEVLERVGEIANSCSSLFEHLGDLYARSGNKKRAIDSYMRAIDLSSDGKTSIPDIKRKLRKLK